jgi:hypothetical protein
VVRSSAASDVYKRQGHGISQFTPPEHVSALVEAVHTHSRALRRWSQKKLLHTANKPS